MLSIPSRPEAHHQIVESLTEYSDRELVELHQQHPDRGKYFTAFFCRYSAIVYSVVQHAAESPTQVDYLFALAWREIFQQLHRVQLSSDLEATNWQNWAIDITGKTIERLDIPFPAQIRYSLAEAPPPLWCYLERGLELIPPLSRSIVVMSHCFKWNEQRIAAYLQGEGEAIAPTAISNHLAEGCNLLEASLPQDIRDIYLASHSNERGN
jgi:hypothetical protein